MLRSLVGSEMCIRDRLDTIPHAYLACCQNEGRTSRFPRSSVHPWLFANRCGAAEQSRTLPPPACAPEWRGRHCQPSRLFLVALGSSRYPTSPTQDPVHYLNVPGHSSPLKHRMLRAFQPFGRGWLVDPGAGVCPVIPHNQNHLTQVRLTPQPHSPALGLAKA